MKIKEAAQALGVHTNTVYRMIEDGRLQAEKKGVEWDVSRDQIDKMLEQSLETLTESTNYYAGIDVIRRYNQATIEVAQRELIKACANLASVDFDKGIEGVEKALLEYKGLKASERHIDDAKSYAKKLEDEAMKALTMSANLLRNNKIQIDQGEV